ncbi:MAG TPA: CYTH domain-containing protein [Rhodocyclaceae bacterium]|nr:CYTH domain-containing protein [Rhodocyclaceae bacterium]
MAIEIERKFLVTGSDWRTASPSRIVQGYLNRDRARTVRVRIAGAEAWLTIKGQNVGASRAEFEYAIPLADAEALLALCDGPLIDKQRHRIPHGKHVWEVDEFFGDNAGLIVAEIELRHEDEAFARPDWLGEEVSNDPRYYNSSLATRPYSQW